MDDRVFPRSNGLVSLRRWLWPLSFFYGALVWLRNALYNAGFFSSYRAPRPVIAIGNLSTGGTGKAPLAGYLIRILLENGPSPAYLSRGYGRQSRGYLRVLPQTMDARAAGDEALQVASRFPQVPVAVSEDRRVGIRRLAEEADPQIFVLDDAFQHRKVARDLDVVVIDAHRLPLKDRLLPAGNLREPVRNLKRADLLIINKVRDEADIAHIEQQLAFLGLPMAFCRPEPAGLMHFSGKPFVRPPQPCAVLFSGIGNNASFHQTVEDMGIAVGEAYTFRDHHPFSDRDLQRIIDRHFHHSTSSPKLGASFLLTTEKDYFRMKNLPWLERFSDYPLTYLPIHLVWLKGEPIIGDLLRPWTHPA